MVAAENDARPSVAVIDSGIAPDGLDGPVLPGINLSGEGEADDTADQCGHGTAVAATIVGIAGAIALVPVKVTDGRGVLRRTEALTTAFDWILEHWRTLHVGVVCAAVGDQGCFVSDDQYRGSGLQQQIAALRAAGVPTVCPAGNWRGRGGYRDGMTWPAILREVVSVGVVRRTPEGLRLVRAGQRLRAASDGGCATTLFAEAGSPGETSGAAAAIAGCLARLAASRRGEAADVLLAALLRLCREAHDEEAASWPAILVEDVLAVERHARSRWALSASP